MKKRVHDIKCMCAKVKRPYNKKVKIEKGCPHSWTGTPETCMDCKNKK